MWRETAKRRSSSVARARRSAASAKLRDGKSKHSSAPRCISICGLRFSPTGGRTQAVFHDLAINSLLEKANELVPASSRDSGLSEMQERTRVPRGGAGTPLSQVPAALRGPRRHPHYADR